MDFFQAQDDARRSTSRLVFFFILAVLALIILTNLLVLLVFGMSADNTNTTQLNLLDQFRWKHFFIIGVAVSLVVAGGSLYKILSLASGGGSAVAESLGGVPVSHSSTEPSQRRLLNVVEEMAIASGTPVPRVYLLENETGINAFAAGFNTRNAVIGVTRGTVERLNRDELQGVIAHEFSHILNGDMRINLRLIGVLHGILLIGLIGYYILRSMSRGRSRSGKNGGGIVVLGFGLMAIGYAGTFFGNIIKASINRQREYLADSSAVQFTRNPSGIAGALKKIGGLQIDNKPGSVLGNENAAELSHAYFSQGTYLKFFTELFSTHPPLEKRIRRVEPGWNGRYLQSSLQEQKKDTPVTEDNTTNSRSQAAVTAVIATAATQLIDHIGRPGHEHLEYARGLLEKIPLTVLESVHTAYGARAVIYCLLINKHKSDSDKQLEYLGNQADEDVHRLVIQLLPVIRNLGIEFRLPLLDISLPALRELSSSQYALFQKNIDALIRMDNKMEIYEWSLKKILNHNLAGIFGKQTSPMAKHHAIRDVQAYCQVLISMLLHTCVTPEHRESALDAARSELGLPQLSLLAMEQINHQRLDEAIDQLSLLMPLKKPALLKACLRTVTQDERYTSNEIELVRAIADSLDCPMPPYTGIHQ